MTLAPGARLGPYEVTALVGRGGMGEVYRAHDTKLGRDVALKVLPDLFASDPKRLARFEREAQVLASLNHPNIANIHGLEEADGVRALVLEFVEGATLADRIAEGPVPIDEALPIAKQIAEALEAAHEHGIIHRDLKPANIKVREDGTVKVLDFGLAKLTDPSAAASVAPGSPREVAASQAPTLTTPAATRTGVIMGTAAYMSPEQAKGKPVDKRADMWAFGCVLFEMLTARRAFEGDDVSETLARVLMKDPEWEALPADTPPTVRTLVRRCLQREPRQRLRDIGEARLVLDGVFGTPAAQPSDVPVTPVALPSVPATPRQVLPLALAAAIGVAVGGLAAWMLQPSPDAPADLMRFAVTASDFTNSPNLRDLTISRDGTTIVYPGAGQLMVRRVDQAEAAPLRGTDGGVGPFVSPDGEWVGFGAAAAATLRKVSIFGGPPLTLATLPAAIRGAVWGPDDRIIVGTQARGLFRVPSGGGEPEALTTSDAERGETGHYWPSLVPNRSIVLFTVGGGAPVASTGQLAALDLDTGEVKRLGLAGVSPQYVSSGHLVYAAQDGSLRAVPFDVRRLEVTGNPVRVLEDVAVKAVGAADFSISDAGRLVYRTGAATQAVPRSLVWVDRNGREEPVRADLQPGQYVYPRIAPDGGRLAVVISRNVAELGSDADVWVLDLARGFCSRITFGGNNRFFPVWTPDGRQVAFSDGPVSPNALRIAQADGGGQIDVILERAGLQYPTSYAPDGKALVFYANNPQTLRDLWILPLDGNRTPVTFLATPFQERAPVFSPNGRWIAYVSDKSGRDEVYVRPYPSTGPQEYTISTGGGVEPVWSRDGRELFYRNADQVLAVAVETAGSFRAAAPKLLLAGSYDLDNSAGGIGGVANYDVALDGKRFVMVKAEPRTDEDTPSDRIHVVLNWHEELKRLVPSN